MTDIRNEFREFFMRVVQPQKKGYKKWIHAKNIDDRLDQIQTAYQKAFGPVELYSFKEEDTQEFISSIQSNLKNKETSFTAYSDDAGSGIPSAILNTHLINFIRFRRNLVFSDLNAMIAELHDQMGNFNNTFQKKRLEFNGNSRVGKKNVLFGDVRDNYWTINLGGEKEIQYHIVNTDDIIGYGLGFNAQGSRNNSDPMGHVQPFVNAYFLNKRLLDEILADYVFFGEDSEQTLKNLQYGKFICLGKTIAKHHDEDKIKLNGLAFLEMAYDLQNKQYEAYQTIYKSITNQTQTTIEEIMSIEILKYKKQIILQGPPGTGKTRQALNIAKHLLDENESYQQKPIVISKSSIQEFIKVGLVLKTVKGSSSYQVNSVSENKVILLGDGIDNKNITFERIINQYSNKNWMADSENGDGRAAAAIAKYIWEEIGSKELPLEQRNEFKLIQFHPSYTYEDLIRGITAKPGADKNQMIFEAENKVLGKFAEEAQQNFIDSQKEGEVTSRENWARNQFEDFVDHLTDDLDANDFISITEKVHITSLDEEAFRYTGANQSWGNTHRMPFREIIKAYLDGSTERSLIKKNPNLSGSAKQHASYYVRVVKLFMAFLVEKKLIYEFGGEEKIKLKNYVLIIDEINRANLSAVLGELIYALEYRGKFMDSMYKVGLENGIVLPENLYIIGTMNSADRSIGTIDYAIRRRFAFIDVLPKVLEGDDFETALFLEVSKLFVEDLITLKPSGFLSMEFRPEDVWLGHSYFIKLKKGNGAYIPSHIRLESEIKPILKEYLKDGVLKDRYNGVETIDFIKSLSVND